MSLYGHINHLYENGDLKFSELKKIFVAATEGKLVGTEKTDGINIYLSFSIKDGEVRAARNLGQLKGGGLSVAEMYNFFFQKEKAARLSNKTYNPEIKNAIKDAMKNFEDAVLYLDLDRQTETFGDFINTANFYNCEILDDRTPNVINYDTKTLVIHQDGHKKVDLRTNQTFDLTDSRQNDLIEKINNLQSNKESDNFHVQVNSIRHLESLSNNEILNHSINVINKILKSNNLTDDNTINEYLVVRLSRYLNKLQIPDLNKKLIIKKMLGIKGIDTNDIIRGLNQDDKKEIRNIINSSREILKKLIEPIEMVIFRFSREILKGMNSVYNLNNSKNNERIKNRIMSAFETMSDSEAASFHTMRKQLSNINMKNFSLPTEGFVFKYNGKVYKLTGDFAPINRLLNFTDKTINVNKDNRIADIALFPGSFKPPHVGHLNAIKELSNLASKIIVIISDPKKDINKRFITENDEMLTEINPIISKRMIEDYAKAANLDSRLEVEISNNPVKKAKEIITSDPEQSKMFVVGSGPDDRQRSAISYLGRQHSNVKPYIIKTNNNIHSTGFRNDLAKKDCKKIVKYLPDEIEDKISFAKEVIDSIFNNNKLINVSDPQSISVVLNEMIVKRKNKYCLLSKATRRNLGCYSSRKKALKREKQVQYFKHMGETSGVGAVAGFTMPLNDKEVTDNE
jgi:cytidyltransferase-like protein